MYFQAFHYSIDHYCLFFFLSIRIFQTWRLNWQLEFKTVSLVNNSWRCWCGFWRGMFRTSRTTLQWLPPTIPRLFEHFLLPLNKLPIFPKQQKKCPSFNVRLPCRRLTSQEIFLTVAIMENFPVGVGTRLSYCPFQRLYGQHLRTLQKRPSWLKTCPNLPSTIDRIFANNFKEL